MYLGGRGERGGGGQGGEQKRCVGADVDVVCCVRAERVRMRRAAGRRG